MCQATGSLLNITALTFTCTYDPCEGHRLSMAKSLPGMKLYPIEIYQPLIWLSGRFSTLKRPHGQCIEYYLVVCQLTWAHTTISRPARKARACETHVFLCAHCPAVVAIVCASQALVVLHQLTPVSGVQRRTGAMKAGVITRRAPAAVQAGVCAARIHLCRVI